MSDLPALATVEDLVVRLGIPEGEINAARAQAILDDVSAFARDEAQRTWDGDEDGDGYDDVVPATVRAIVLAAAMRIYNNPEGYASEQAGDYSYRLPADRVPDAVFTDGELAKLRRFRRNGSGLWTMQVSGSAELHTVYWAVQGSGESVPMFDRADLGL